MRAYKIDPDELTHYYATLGLDIEQRTRLVHSFLDRCLELVIQTGLAGSVSERMTKAENFLDNVMVDLVTHKNALKPFVGKYRLDIPELTRSIPVLPKTFVNLEPFLVDKVPNDRDYLTTKPERLARLTRAVKTLLPNLDINTVNTKMLRELDLIPSYTVAREICEFVAIAIIFKATDHFLTIKYDHPFISMREEPVSADTKREEREAEFAAYGISLSNLEKAAAENPVVRATLQDLIGKLKL